MIHYFSHCIVFTLFFNELILFIYIILLYSILFHFVLYCFILSSYILFYLTLFYFTLFYIVLSHFILFYFILFYFITFCQRYRFHFINSIISSSIIFGKYNFFSDTQLYRKCFKHWKLVYRKTNL